MKSSREVCQDLAKRLAGAAHSSAHNHPEEHCEERWSLVADTIEMMIDRAIQEHEQRSAGKGMKSMSPSSNKDTGRSRLAGNGCLTQSGPARLHLQHSDGR